MGIWFVSSGVGPLTQVQRKTTFINSGTTVTVTLSPAATAGNLLAGFATHDKAATSWTAPGGWSTVQQFLGVNTSFWMGYKVAAGGETTTTLTSGASLAKTFAVYEYSGLTSSPLDVSQQNNFDSTLVSSISTGTTASTAQADELAFALSSVDSGTNVDAATRSWSNGFTEDVWIYDTPRSAAPGQSVAINTLTSIGTVESTYSYTGGAADEHAAAIMTFKRQ